MPYTINTSNALVNGLGGSAGFGEGALSRNDDGSSSRIDITPVFGAAGLNFFGNYYTSLYVNNNGNITFGYATSQYTPGTISGGTSNPIIAPFWGDVDTRGTTVVATPGGNSQGTNLVYYDLDTVNRVFTATWDDVGYYSYGSNKLNAFQLQLVDRGNGNFDMVFRYEDINWTTGGASGGTNGLGGTVARMGYNSGNGTDFYEFPISGNQASVLNLDSVWGNTGYTGLYVFSVNNGQVLPTLTITATNADKAEGNSGTTPFTFTVTRGGNTGVATTVNWNVTATEGQPSANAADFSGGVFPSGTLSFAAGETSKTITVNVAGDTLYESGAVPEYFTVNLSNASGGATILTDSADGRIRNDDAYVSDDYANTTATTGAVAVGGATTGRIETVGDHDWFRISLTAGTTYQFRLNATGTIGLTDPYLNLYNGSGSLITSNDDGGGNLNSLITYTATSGGTYYLGARAYGSGTGSYTVSATALSTDDYANTTATSGVVTVGGTSTGRIETVGDNDWFRVSLTAGTTYQFRLNAASTDGLRDPYLNLYNASGTPIAANDDGGGNLNSLITYTATSSGTYYLGARAYGSGTGSYTVAATALSTDDYLASTATTGSVTVGSSSTGRIETVGDNDWFRVSLTAGTTYQFRLNAASTDGLRDPYLNLYNGSGSLITSNDDGGGNLNSLVTYTATSSGTYYLGARAYGSGTGSYTVSATGYSTDDYLATTATSGVVTVGGTSTGRIETVGDNDWFRVSLTEGTTYQFRLNAASINGLGDPYLNLYTSNGTLITANDDGGGNANSLITYTAATTGTYYLGARAYGNGTGAYTLSAVEVETPTAPAGSFNIDVNYVGAAEYRAVFESAAQHWEQIITQDLANVSSTLYGNIDDLLIDASVVSIDGSGGILGQAAPNLFRSGSLLPAHGFMQFDSADLQAMLNNGTLQSVIEHEMAHVLGFGTLWNALSLKDSNGNYIGVNALDEYRAWASNYALTAVPVEQNGGPGTAGAHWSESVFGAELMTGWLDSGVDTPTSSITIGALEDLGYTVNYNMADLYPGSLSALQTSAASASQPVEAETTVVMTSLQVASVAAISAESSIPVGFTGTSYLHLADKPIVMSASDESIKINGVVTQLNEDSVYFFETTTGNDYMFVLQGAFEKNSATAAENIKGSVTSVSVFAGGTLVNEITYHGAAQDAEQLLLNWQPFDPDQDNYIASQSTEPQNDVVMGFGGSDILITGAGFDTAVWTASTADVTLGYGEGVWQVQDNVGNEGTDSLVGVERLQFADRTVILDSQAPAWSYDGLPPELYHFFIVAFNAAPGVTYMDQLAEAWAWFDGVQHDPNAMQTIVELFTTKQQFTDVYASDMPNHDLAVEMVNQIVKTSADAQAKSEAVADIEWCLDNGWTRGEVIYTVFGNLASKDPSDPVWGATSTQFWNEIAVAQFYTEQMQQSTTDLQTLRDAIAAVNQDSVVATEPDVVALIGVGLLGNALV